MQKGKHITGSNSANLSLAVTLKFQHEIILKNSSKMNWTVIL